MSFLNKNLSVLAYANGFTLWHYKTTDSSVEIEGYFNNATDTLRVGDMVIANVATATTLATKLYMVADNSEGVVEISDIAPAAEPEGSGS